MWTWRLLLGGRRVVGWKEECWWKTKYRSAKGRAGIEEGGVGGGETGMKEGGRDDREIYRWEGRGMQGMEQCSCEKGCIWEIMMTEGGMWVERVVCQMWDKEGGHKGCCSYNSECERWFLLITLLYKLTEIITLFLHKVYSAHVCMLAWSGLGMLHAICYMHVYHVHSCQLAYTNICLFNSSPHMAGCQAEKSNLFSCHYFHANFPRSAGCKSCAERPEIRLTRSGHVTHVIFISGVVACDLAWHAFPMVFAFRFVPPLVPISLSVSQNTIDETTIDVSPSAARPQVAGLLLWMAPFRRDCKYHFAVATLT